MPHAQQKNIGIEHQNEEIVAVIPKIEKNNLKTADCVYKQASAQEHPIASVVPIDIPRTNDRITENRAQQEQIRCGTGYGTGDCKDEIGEYSPERLN